MAQHRNAHELREKKTGQKADRWGSVFHLATALRSQRLFSHCLNQFGNTLIEVGITLPIIIILIVGTLDLGRAVYAQNVISNAAREGARYGTTPPIDLQDIENKTKSYITTLDPSRVSVSATQPTPSTIRVTVIYTFTAATPLVGNLIGDNGTFAFVGVSTMTIEGSG